MSLRTFGKPSRIQPRKLDMCGNLALTQDEALAIFNILDYATRMHSPASKRAQAKIRRALEIAEGTL